MVYIPCYNCETGQIKLDVDDHPNNGKCCVCGIEASKRGERDYA